MLHLSIKKFTSTHFLQTLSWEMFIIYDARHTLDAPRQSFHLQTRPVWEIREPLRNPGKGKHQKQLRGSRVERVPQEPGEGKGLPHQRKPHSADKSLQGRHCWNSAPVLSCCHFTNTAPGTAGMAILQWEWSDGKRGSEQSWRQRHMQRASLCAGVAQPGVTWCFQSCSELEEIPWIMNFQFWISLFSWFCPQGAALSLFLAGFGKISRQRGAASVAFFTRWIMQHKQFHLPSQLPAWPCSPGCKDHSSPLWISFDETKQEKCTRSSDGTTATATKK